jgi:hypothetical protein
MKSKSAIFGVLLLIGSIGAGLVYANVEALQAALAAAAGHSHGLQGAAAPGRGGDHFGCHRHGAVTYHCH